MPDPRTSWSKFLAVRSTAPALAPSTRPMRARARIIVDFICEIDLRGRERRGSVVQSSGTTSEGRENKEKKNANNTLLTEANREKNGKKTIRRSGRARRCPENTTYRAVRGAVSGLKRAGKGHQGTLSKGLSVMRTGQDRLARRSKQ